VKTNIDVLEPVEKWMAPGMEEIGRKCQAGQIYLPELALSARVFRTAMNLFEPKGQGYHWKSTD
jgi:methanogenic corrinoid protein MtbC1